MKMSKNPIFVCFALCLLIQISGCSFFSGNESAEKPNQKGKISELQTENNEDTEAIVTARNKLEKAKSSLEAKKVDLKEGKSAAEDARKQCGTMMNQSINANNLNYKNANSDTGKKCSEAIRLETEYSNNLKPLQKDVDDAQADLDKIKPTAGTRNQLSDLILPILIGLAVLLLIGGISFLIYRISKNAKHERAATQDGFKTIGAKQSGLRQDVDQLKTATELLSKQLSEQRNEIATLKRQTQGRDVFSAPPLAPAFAPTVPEFPVSVENYMTKNAGGATFGKHDPLFGTLKENNDDGAFYLIRDGVLSDDVRYAVPRTKQFVTKDDFVYHYSNYYICTNPSGGEVWIKKPSTVRRTADGWKLEAMGELEIY